MWVDPAEIAAPADIYALASAPALGPRGEQDELMANVAAYAGLRRSELFALTTAQYIEAPKNRRRPELLCTRLGHPNHPEPGYPSGMRTPRTRVKPSPFLLLALAAALAAALSGCMARLLMAR